MMEVIIIPLIYGGIVGYKIRTNKKIKSIRYHTLEHPDAATLFVLPDTK